MQPYGIYPIAPTSSPASRYIANTILAEHLEMISSERPYHPNPLVDMTVRVFMDDPRYKLADHHFVDENTGYIMQRGENDAVFRSHQIKLILTNGRSWPYAIVNDLTMDDDKAPIEPFVTFKGGNFNAAQFLNKQLKLGIQTSLPDNYPYEFVNACVDENLKAFFAEAHDGQLVVKVSGLGSGEGPVRKAIGAGNNDAVEIGFPSGIKEIAKRAGITLRI